MRTHWLSLVPSPARGSYSGLISQTAHIKSIWYSTMLYSSTDPVQDNRSIDANSYPPFKIVDSNVIQVIMNETDALAGKEEEGWPSFKIINPKESPLKHHCSTMRTCRCHHKGSVLLVAFPCNFHDDDSIYKIQIQIESYIHQPPATLEMTLPSCQTRGSSFFRCLPIYPRHIFQSWTPSSLPRN